MRLGCSLSLLCLASLPSGSSLAEPVFYASMAKGPASCFEELAKMSLARLKAGPHLRLASLGKQHFWNPNSHSYMVVDTRQGTPYSLRIEASDNSSRCYLAGPAGQVTRVFVLKSNTGNAVAEGILTDHTTLGSFFSGRPPTTPSSLNIRDVTLP